MTERGPAPTGSTEVVQAQPAPAGPGRPRAAAAPKKKPGFGPTIFVALATFGLLFEFLAFQLNNGNDPALGASVLAANRDPKVARVDRPVVNRKIIKTKVVHDPPAASSSVVPVSSGSTNSAVAPATSSAPAPVAAAPAPAPAPAPVTSSS